MTQLWGCASLHDCGWTGAQPGRKDGVEFCPNCGGFVAQRRLSDEKKPALEEGTAGVTAVDHQTFRTSDADGGKAKP